MDRAILHCDLNNFYASVECTKNPEYKDIPLAVTGNPKKRTGIVLAKNTLAKKCGVKTGDVIWKAKQLCPNIVCVSPDFESYAKYSEKVKQIYLKYTDFVEPFGIDECWLDITHSQKLFGSPYKIAEKIKNEIKQTLGLTISIGISFSKMFAKLGSKLAGNDEINAITKADYKEKTWHLPVENLIYVGRKRLVQFKKMNINTIGDLAKTDKDLMIAQYGVNGEYLVKIANGCEPDNVSNYNNLRTIKSIGNGTTSIVDISSFEQAKQLIFYLSETIAKRLREKGFKCLCINLAIKDTSLKFIAHSKTFESPTNNALEIAMFCIDLFKKNWDFSKQKEPIRAIRIATSNLISDKESFQTNLFDDLTTKEKALKTDTTIDKIKNKYGENKIKRALLLNAKHINCEISDDFFEEL